MRENGGQYTHGAIWVAMAFARLGETERAWQIMSMINPVNHALSRAAVGRYKVEPYVVSADVYAVEPHVGRGGWSWYTGSAGWMYRLVLESLLGLTLEGDRLHLSPRIPTDWKGFTLHYRYRETIYHIVVSQSAGDVAGGHPTIRMTIDGVDHADRTIPMCDDRLEHRVEVLVTVDDRARPLQPAPNNE